MYNPRRPTYRKTESQLRWASELPDSIKAILMQSWTPMGNTVTMKAVMLKVTIRDIRRTVDFWHDARDWSSVRAFRVCRVTINTIGNTDITTMIIRMVKYATCTLICPLNTRANREIIYDAMAMDSTQIMREISFTFVTVRQTWLFKGWTKRKKRQKWQ